MNREEQRLEESRERKLHWKRWGPYLSERQWGTVREDYSEWGTAWDYFPHDHARSRAYRWGEDGIAGICDRHQFLCFALALWNGRDPILKERLFGLTGEEGNHGEDVKEYYAYLDSTPTHSYMKYLYRYPQGEFPYAWLVDENKRRGRKDAEFELVDSGIFHENRFFDVFTEYAKATPDDILIRITVHNRGPEAATLQLLPTLWFRNTWSWGRDDWRPSLAREADLAGAAVIRAEHRSYGSRWLICQDHPELLFTENETNYQRLFGVGNRTPHVKDGINDYVVQGLRHAVNPLPEGTKAAVSYRAEIPPGQSAVFRLRLTDEQPVEDALCDGFDTVFEERIAEANEFYSKAIPAALSADAQNVFRQAMGGLFWSKQFYHYDVRVWLEGDPAGPPPPAERRMERNHSWTHLYNADVLSMPDKWEYPWYAAWDLAFHCVAMALVDPDYAKEQLILLLREWYQHPNGQLPAYEWAFSDVNPPVHAWAAWRVYKIEKRRRGSADREFLEKVFHKLLLNFTWWVNRKDPDGRNVFEGGFLGLDNIGVFDRSRPLPTGGHIEQSDGTSWMGTYCLEMLAIAMELARRRSCLRGRGQQILRALCLHHPGHEQPGRPWNFSVGRGGRLLLRRAASPQWTARFYEGPVRSGTDSASCGGSAGAGGRGRITRLQAAHAMVPRQCSQRPPSHRNDANLHPRNSPPAFHRQPPETGENSSLHAGRAGVPFPPRNSQRLQIPCAESLCIDHR